MTAKTQDVETIRTEIEHTRHELGGTVEALAAKVDVKARAREAAASARAWTRTWTRAHRGTIAPAALAVATATALLMLRRRRRNQPWYRR